MEKRPKFSQWKKKETRVCDLKIKVNRQNQNMIIKV